MCALAVPLPKDADKRYHGGLVKEPHPIPSRHLVSTPLFGDILDRPASEVSTGLHCGNILFSDVRGCSVTGEAQEHRPMEKHSEILVPPFHDTSCDVQGLCAGVSRPEKPGQIVIPVNELVVQPSAVLCRKQRRDGQHILDLGSNFAKLNVLD